MSIFAAGSPCVCRPLNLVSPIKLERILIPSFKRGLLRKMDLCTGSFKNSGPCMSTQAKLYRRIPDQGVVETCSASSQQAPSVPARHIPARQTCTIRRAVRTRPSVQSEVKITNSPLLGYAIAELLLMEKFMYS